MSLLDDYLSEKADRKREGNLRRSMKHYYKRKYGITAADKEKLLAAQGGKCAVCPSTSPGSRKGWHVDHCHKTGRVRGILCQGCNLALGHVADSPQRLRDLASYLEAAI